MKSTAKNRFVTGVILANIVKSSPSSDINPQLLAKVQEVVGKWRKDFKPK